MGDNFLYLLTHNFAYFTLKFTTSVNFYLDLKSGTDRSPGPNLRNALGYKFKTNSCQSSTIRYNFDSKFHREQPEHQHWAGLETRKLSDVQELCTATDSEGTGCTASPRQYTGSDASPKFGERPRGGATDAAELETELER